MNNKLSFSALLLLALPAAAAQVASHSPTVFSQAPAQAAPHGPAAMPVVRVNGAVLTEEDLLREEYTIFPYARQHKGIPKDLEPQIRSGALNMIIFEELVYQEAQRRKMTVAPAKMQRAETEFRKQFATPDEFNAYMQAEFHGSQKLLEDQIRRSLLIDAFLDVEVEARSKVTPAEVKAYYDKNPARFEHPETYTFQTISFLPPPKATAAQVKEGRARADKALPEAKAARTAEAFGMLAEKISDDDYRVMMGQHKPLPANQLAPQVVKAFLSMKAGDVTDVIQIDQAYTIVRMNAHTPAGKTKFEDVKAQLEKEVEQNKTNAIRSALDHKLRQNAKVEGM